MPSLRQVDAWAGEAPPALVGVALTRALVDCGIRMQPEEITSLSSLLARRGYSPAELSYAAGELPFDTEIDWKKKQGQSLTAADFERHVTAIRRLRASLRMALRLIDVNKIVSEFPSLLSVEDFGYAGEGSHGEAIYRYAMRRRPAKMEPITELPESTVPDRAPAGTGTFRLHELINPPSEQAA